MCFQVLISLLSLTEPQWCWTYRTWFKI